MLGFYTRSGTLSYTSPTGANPRSIQVTLSCDANDRAIAPLGSASSYLPQGQLLHTRTRVTSPAARPWDLVLTFMLFPSPDTSMDAPLEVLCADLTP